MFFIAFAVAFGEAIRANHQQTLDSLRAAVASERWEVKRQGRELRALSVNVGRRLHGDVQSQLSVLSLTLMALADSPEATDEDRRAALVNALSIVESLEVRVTDPQGSNEKSEFIEALPRSETHGEDSSTLSYTSRTTCSSLSTCLKSVGI